MKIMDKIQRNYFRAFASWITIATILIGYVEVSIGLQGTPTWICLGVKSPFIEFKPEQEILLANSSVALNITTSVNGIDRNVIHRKGLLTQGNFIKMDNMNGTFKQKGVTAQEAIRKQQEFQMVQLNKVDSGIRNPIEQEMNHKEITLIEETDDGNGEVFGNRPKETKYIVPMPLRDPEPLIAIEEKKSREVPPPPTPAHIDELKNHIRMLQNMTKHSEQFESKFVVFPHLQKNKTFVSMEPSTTSSATTTTTTTMRTTIHDQSDEFITTDKIIIVPQVIAIQNDQSLMNDDSGEGLRSGDNTKDQQRTTVINGNSGNEIRLSYSRQQPTESIIVSSTTPRIQRSGKPSRKPKIGGRKNKNKNKNKKQKQCDKGIDCIKNSSGTDNVKKLSGIILMKNNKTVDWSILSSSSSDNTPFNMRSDETTQIGMNKSLQRIIRSPSFIGGNGGNRKRELITPIPSPKTSGQVKNSLDSNKNITTEVIDLNPDHCYEVNGLTVTQQKLCAQHTDMMPAISRGARAAIQECKHQFNNRRWNCSTVDDNTVFGPITSLGTPEMAFVHALAAATVASFVARACRDGQLTSCGCSRSSRPKHLHTDWAWGGCGDDLEFGYKFAQNFIDVREKERKRGTRGVITIPQKFSKLEEKLLTEGVNETNPAVDIGSTDTNSSDPDSMSKDNEAANKINADALMELQQKIAKEILSAKLQEDERSELQAKINREIMNSKVFKKEKNERRGRGKRAELNKARSLMNLHNNEVGRRAVIKKSKITCKCHGVSGSCSLITCWQQLTSIREIGDYLREKYDEATQVKLNKRGRLQVRDALYNVPTALDLVYLEESPDWCRVNNKLQWPGTHGRQCNKTSSGLDGCSILCCGRGYNTKKIIVKERCNCKFHWCCHVKCDTCTKIIEEHTCK